MHQEATIKKNSIMARIAIIGAGLIRRRPLGLPPTLIHAIRLVEAYAVHVAWPSVR